MPKIPKEFLSCTFYLYPSAEDAESGKGFGGTGFLVGVQSETDPHKMYVYGVTNWHVACRDGHSVARLFKKDGSPAIYEYGPEDWKFIPGGDDIAVVPIAIGDQPIDFKCVPLENFITRDRFESGKIGIGDDVFMVGRFIDHDGGGRNAPAARFGNISILPESKIKTPNGALHETWCIDMHSRTGYSGSPVFVYRTPGNDLTSGVIDMGDRFLLLLGIHWGQFPEMWELGNKKKLEEVAQREPLVIDGGYVKGLSGMTCVAPAWSIVDTLNLPKFKNIRAKADIMLKRKLEEDAAKTPVAESTPPTTGENPQHREDFSRLLNAAAKGSKPSPQKS